MLLIAVCVFIEGTNYWEEGVTKMKPIARFIQVALC